MSSECDIKIIDVDEQPDARAPELHAPAITKEFLLGGRAYFVVTNPARVEYQYVIRARTPRRGSKWDTTAFFVRVQKNGEYRYVGILDPETGVLSPVGRSEFTTGTLEFNVAQWAIQTIFTDSPLRPGYSITHRAKCAACGKMLTGQGDITMGFHLECTPDHMGDR